MIWRAAICWALLASVAVAAEVQPAYPEYSLCRIKLAEGESVSVLSRSFEPVAVVQGSAIAVFTGRPDRYAVIVSEVGGGTRILFTEIRRGDAPPDPGPGPDNPTPVVPPNAYGVGKVAYDNAVSVGDKAGAAVLADIWSSGASKFAATSSGNLIADVTAINQEIAANSRARLADSARWSTWATSVKTALAATWDRGNNTRDAYAATMREVAEAMRLAAR